jgi:hypothetical protein
MCPLAVSSIGDGLGEATRQALQQGGQFAANTRTYHGGMRTGGAAYGVNPMMGGRRASRKRMMYGGMAPLSAFDNQGVDVPRASAHLIGQDNAINEAAAFSRTLAGTDNPAASGSRMVGGVRRKMSRRRRGRKSHRNRKSHRRMRGGAILNGTGAPSDAPYMLLADDPALQNAAAQVENPAWAGVAKMQFA